MNKSYVGELGKGLLWLLWIGVLSSWIVYGIYFFNFAPGQWFQLSSDPADWGVFGDFVGGLLNPFFSFLAFIGVVCTVVLQARQLEIVRNQASFEELQRVLSTLSSRLDHLLATTPEVIFYGQAGSNKNSQTFYELIAGLGTLSLKRLVGDESDWLASHVLEQSMQSVREAIKSQLTVLGLEFETLAWTLDRYANDGGSEAVIDFYKYRYRPVICWLDAMGLLDSHQRIQNVFKPKDFREFMV